VKIVIDPGHGGSDPGARGPYGLLEKSVCLEVALRLGELIEDDVRGSEVIYTRSDDQSLSPQRRATTANEASADLFISIHAGQLAEGQGLQVYYAGGGAGKKSVGPVNNRGASQISLQLASAVQKSLAREFTSKTNEAPMRAPAQPEFAVLNGVEAPAIVAEIPFSDNDSPLLDPTQRQKLADAIYRGIADFVKALPARTNQ
jgi:N-acetylmuramoyl-L-alanine amidase